MAIYTIHSRGFEPEAIGDARVLRDGFSWDAFWLGPFWLLRHKLYALLAAWIGAVVVLVIATSTVLSPGAGIVIALGLELLLGLEAFDLRQAALAKDGYRLVDIIAAETLDEAEISFFRRHGTDSGGSRRDPEARP